MNVNEAFSILGRHCSFQIQIHSVINFTSHYGTITLPKSIDVRKGHGIGYRQTAAAASATGRAIWSALIILAPRKNSRLNRTTTWLVGGSKFSVSIGAARRLPERKPVLQCWYTSVISSRIGLPFHAGEIPSDLTAQYRCQNVSRDLFGFQIILAPLPLYVYGYACIRTVIN